MTFTSPEATIESGAWRVVLSRYLAFAVGNSLITIGSLVPALILAGNRTSPAEGIARVAGVAIMFGVSYTVFSERLNIVVRKSRAYSEPMPMLPVIDTGLSPLVQRIVIPPAGIRWARRPVARF
jgi:hypothetical protein